MANSKCKECGCSCKRCITSDHDVHLHVEIESLKHKLLERDNYIVTMETNFLNEANKFPNGELNALKEELLTWQDKYKRLYDAHRRVQRVNQGLEDKLLKLVDATETDKNTLTKDVATLSHKLAEANYMIKKLTDDNERYKNDVNLAIQFLQCKQSNFVAHKFESLPQEIQSQVSTYMTTKKKPDDRKTPPEIKSIKVPIPTFPPTAMVYSVPKSPNVDRKVLEEPENQDVDIVSAAIMAKVLEERQKERACIKHCDTCTCSKNLKIIYDSTHHTVGTQTGEYKSSLCLQCNSILESSSARVKIVRAAKPKNVPTYSNDQSDCVQINGNNIVKVQPNNFLLDNVTLTDDTIKSNLINLHPESSQEESHKEKNLQAYDISVCSSVNDIANKRLNKYYVNHKAKENLVRTQLKPETSVSTKHHHLCNKTSPNYNMEPPPVEKSEVEKNIDKTSAKNEPSGNLKGPRYCSMRFQSGSKNILLDNAHSNLAPVLYTRQHRKPDYTPKTHEVSHAGSSSSEEVKTGSVVSSDSGQNEQRVADWIQSTIDNDLSSSENSRSDSVKNNNSSEVDKARYVEMEENVKRFLFGESEFLKTVELGKLKYLIIRENEKVVFPDNDSSKSNSHTETEI